MANSVNYIILVIVGAILLAGAIGWLYKKFFQVNTKQIQTKTYKKGRAFISQSSESDGSSSNVINESNNALSQKPFDGVNINPEQTNKRP